MRNAYPKRCSLPGVTVVQGVWTGGGAGAACTKAAADHSEGIASVAYNSATGKYLVTFTDVGQQIVGGSVEVYRRTSDEPMVGNLVRGGYSRSAKTVEFTVHEMLDATCNLTDLLTTDQVCITVEFSNFAPDA